MIYEMRIYTLGVGQANEYFEQFGKSFEQRQKMSRLIGLFRAEIGDLNRVMHIWEYENAGERARIRAESMTKDFWPPSTGHLVQRQVTKLMTTPPFLPEPRLGEMGNFYEVRTYTTQFGKMKNVLEKWTNSLPDREKLSKAAAVFITESGELNQFIHIWPYRDLNHRWETRAESEKLPNWPPGSRPFLMAQNTEIWVPAPYSLMR
ncbi:MAG: NIPSNAP family protein [bacterium]|nr:NIPSNAP family protein [bacterium]